MATRLNRLAREPIFVLESDVRLGMFRIDEMQEFNNAREISIIVAPNNFGAGVGSHMIETYFAKFSSGSYEYFARIHQHNQISLEFFKKHGFQPFSQINQFILHKRMVKND